MPCSVAVGYQRFGGSCCLHLQSLHPEDGDSLDLQNVGVLPQHFTASQPKRRRLESSPP